MDSMAAGGSLNLSPNILLNQAGLHHSEYYDSWLWSQHNIQYTIVLYTITYHYLHHLHENLRDFTQPRVFFPKKRGVIFTGRQPRRWISSCVPLLWPSFLPLSVLECQQEIVEKPRGAWMSPGEDGEDGEDLTLGSVGFLDAKNDS